MTITSRKNFVSGQPSIGVERLWVGHIVYNIREMGMEEYIEDFDLQHCRNEIREAIDYCRKEMCEGNVIRYCQFCNKNKELPGEDLWKTAEKLYRKNF
ncbi:MAG: hypothetical protein Q7S27_05645 [Nanoarchaeota archaeon]|nr:hypothetical protein [Nanoarchaeota archaeon]